MTSSATIEAVEGDLFETLLSGPGDVEAQPIFILGAPRTGSTIFYQCLVSAFELPFFANFTNLRFPLTPIVGLWLQAGRPRREKISSLSRYGKTDGRWQPSEASEVMTGWFGGGHPSELLSNAALAEREHHLLTTMAAAQRLFGRPLVVKNAWNCFRVEYLASALPGASFIWIRRDIAAAARSDLAARYAVQGDPCTWNSATPRNWEALRNRPYTEQVVENQFEFSRAIADGLRRIERGRSCEVWYEDLCAEPAQTMAAVASACAPLSGDRLRVREIPDISASKGSSTLPAADDEAIDAFLAGEHGRFSPLRYATRESSGQRPDPLIRRRG